LRRKRLGDSHHDTLQTMSNLGEVLRIQGKLQGAEPLLREAVEGRRKLLGDKHAFTIGTTEKLAMLYQQTNRVSEAEILLARLCEPEALSQVTPDQQARLIARWGVVMSKLGRLDQAQEKLLDGMSRLKATNQTNAQMTTETLRGLRQQRPDDAAKWRRDLGAIGSTTRAGD
jgi:hypothetical protein